MSDQVLAYLVVAGIFAWVIGWKFLSRTAAHAAATAIDNKRQQTKASKPAKWTLVASSGTRRDEILAALTASTDTDLAALSTRRGSFKTEAAVLCESPAAGRSEQARAVSLQVARAVDPDCRLELTGTTRLTA